METAQHQPSPAPLAISPGQGLLRGTWLFDFETGIEASRFELADVWWEQQTSTARRLTPLNGARVCSIGIVDYDALGFSDLVKLPYSTTPIPGNVTGTNSLIDGSVFAVHTRLGSYVKVQVIHYDYNLQIRWQSCTPPLNYLNVNVILGTTPDWLVARYVVECSYSTRNGIRNCGRGVFNAGGGIVTGKVSDEDGAFPATILVTIAIDFQPDTGLAGLVRSFTPPVTNTGVNFLFEPYHVIQKTDVIFDLQPPPLERDYLSLRWRHVVGGAVIAAGQKVLPGDELRKQSITQYEIVFVPDPLLARDFSIEIEGRYQDISLPSFTETYDLSKKAIIIRVQKAPPGPGYILVSV